MDVHVVKAATEFQSTPPRGGDSCLGLWDVYLAISIHAPSRGRLVNRVSVLKRAGISIHAPSRGRRETEAVKGGKHHISIHAPSRGRPSNAGNSVEENYFNPRPLAGATIYDDDNKTMDLISIHAPSRGRLYIYRRRTRYRHFNPRPLAGATARLRC